VPLKWCGLSQAAPIVRVESSRSPDESSETSRTARSERAVLGQTRWIGPTGGDAGVGVDPADEPRVVGVESDGQAATVGIRVRSWVRASLA
jgi:hypothetical protein